MPDEIYLAVDNAEKDPKVWKPKLMLQLQKHDKTGEPHPTASNAILILTNDLRVKNCLGYNEFKNEAALLSPPPAMGGVSMPGPYPRCWTSEDVTFFHAFLEKEWSHKFSRAITEAAMMAAAAQNRHHPVREWLAGLVWDGVERLDTWLHHTFETPDDVYHSSVGRKFLIAAVRRIRQPGCKFDHMPIFEGSQGIGKSTALRILFGENWFSDSLPAPLDHKDAAVGLVGVWGLELAEIEQVIRSEVEVVKAFISRAVDRYRPSYGRTYIEVPRQGVMMGSTNAADYLRDSTGNRRFWPVKCKVANIRWLEQHQEQLWAEAAQQEQDGESIWLDDNLAVISATRHQEDRLEEDVWLPRVEQFLLGRTEVAIPEILSDCLLIPAERQGRREQMRLGKILTVLHYHRGTAWRGGKAKKVWKRERDGNISCDDQSEGG